MANKKVITFIEDIDEFIREMRHSREVHFLYRKTNGALRDAYGTKCFTEIPKSLWPKGISPTPDYLFKYWDTQRGGWRTMLKEKFIAYEEVDPSMYVKEEDLINLNINQKFKHYE